MNLYTHKMGEAMDIFRKPKKLECNPILLPTIFLSDGLHKAQRVEDVLSLLSEMVDQEMNPKTIT